MQSQICHVCPRCGHTDTKKAGQKNGLQRWECKKCHKRFSLGEPYIPRPLNEKRFEECPHCSAQAQSRHLSTPGKWVFHCSNCNKHFVDPRERKNELQKDQPIIPATRCMNCFKPCDRLPGLTIGECCVDELGLWRKVKIG